jgi:hypothetical protein
VEQKSINGMKPEIEEELDVSSQGPAEYHANKSTYDPAIAGLETETKSYSTVAETCLASSSNFLKGPDSQNNSPFYLSQQHLLSWEELVSLYQTSTKHFLGIMDAYSLFLACRPKIGRSFVAAKIIDTELGSLAFRTFFNNTPRADLVCSLELLGKTRVFSKKSRAALLFPGLFNQIDVDSIIARGSVIRELISKSSEKQYKTNKEWTITGIQGIQKSTAETLPRIRLMSDQTQVTEAKTLTTHMVTHGTTPRPHHWLNL